MKRALDKMACSSNESQRMQNLSSFEARNKLTVNPEPHYKFINSNAKFAYLVNIVISENLKLQSGNTASQGKAVSDKCFN